MLNKLFRPKWQHPDKSTRLQAVKQLEAGDQETLQQIAETDSDAEVRQCAISRLDSLSLLMQTHKRTAYPQDQPFIEQCWCAVLADPQLTTPEKAEHIILECKKPHWLAAIACHSIDPSHQMLALGGLSDEQTLLQLLQDSNNHKLWQILAEQLQSENALKQALAIIGDRDKRTLQIVREKREKLKEQQRHAEEQAGQLEQLEQRLQQLLQGEYNPLFEGTLLNLEQQWQALQLVAEQPTADTVNSLITDCRRRLDEHKEDQLQAEEQQQALQTLEQEIGQLLSALQEDLSATASRQSHCRQLQQRLDELNNDNPLFSRLNEQLHRCSDLLNLLERLQPLEASLQEAMDKPQGPDIDSVAGLQADCRKALSLCRKNERLRDKQNRFESWLAQLEKKQTQQKQQAKEKGQQLQQWIDKADKAIADDQLQQAAGLLQKIRSTIGELGREQRQPFESAIQRIQAATRNLKDWQRFATEPKRQELCDGMARLIDTDLPPEEKADAIKALQKQWKALGFCEDQALWQRFQQLGDEAFAPCKTFFAEQKERMHFNAEQRTIICEQTEQFLQQTDWQSCDYRAIDQLFKSINNEWQKYAPVPHSRHKALQKRFNQSRDTLRDKLNAERRKNTDHLQSLVDQARALAECDDINQAISDYQQLHEQWKHTGISFRKAQQALWQELREAGNAIYARRNDIRQQSEQEQQANLEQARSVIDAIQSLSQSQALDTAEFAKLKQQFNHIESLPKNAWRETRTAFNNACKAVDHALQKQQQQAFYRQLQDAARAWQNNDRQTVQKLPDAWRAVLEKPASQEDKERLARKLCIELEILCDKPTPEADNKVRMELQMDKLAQRFNHKAENSFADDFAGVYLSWHKLDYRAEPLASRFNELAGMVIKGEG